MYGEVTQFNIPISDLLWAT